MSESKHTPGPWVASGQSVSAPGSQGVSVGWCGTAGASGPDGSYYISREEAEANAALIARAPELLAENEELMEAHQALGHEYEMLARERDKLQADLDAALDLLISMHERMSRPPQERLDAAWKRIEPLLAESEPNPGKTHYQGDDCPGGHESKCGYCGSPCERCTQPAEPVLKLGHEFERAYHSESFCVAPGKCHKVVGIKVCGQPREAH